MRVVTINRNIFFFLNILCISLFSFGIPNVLNSVQFGVCLEKRVRMESADIFISSNNSSRDVIETRSIINDSNKYDHDYLTCVQFRNLLPTSYNSNNPTGKMEKVGKVKLSSVIKSKNVNMREWRRAYVSF